VSFRYEISSFGITVEGDDGYLDYIPFEYITNINLRPICPRKGEDTPNFSLVITTVGAENISVQSNRKPFIKKAFDEMVRGLEAHRRLEHWG